jgi:hypothetical protein
MLTDKPHDMIDLPDGNKCRVVEHPLLGSACLQIDDEYIELGDIRRANLAKIVYDVGRRGPVPIPKDPEHCARIQGRIERYLADLEEEIWNRAAMKTSDLRRQAKIVSIVMHRVLMKANQPAEGSATITSVGGSPRSSRRRRRRAG